MESCPNMGPSRLGDCLIEEGATIATSFPARKSDFTSSISSLHVSILLTSDYNMVTHNLPSIAYLCVQDGSGDAIEWPLYANDECSFGRPEIEDLIKVKAPCVSKHHLRFRSVMYEEDGETRVAPMIYVRVLSKNPVQLTRRTVSGTDCSCRISRGQADVLLNDEDVLQLTPSISVVFHAEDEYAAVSDGLNNTQKKEFELLRPYYEVTNRRLGVGGQASVFVAIKQHSQRQVACKVLPVPFISAKTEQHIRSDATLDEDDREGQIYRLQEHLRKQRARLTREYSVLKDLSHPNIVSLEKVIYTPNNIYIFQELITGGDLLSYTELKGVLSEPQAAVIVRQILKAVDYLHRNGIVHRDIKPENVLMTSWRDGARIVLTDFGQARVINDAKAGINTPTVSRMQTLVGTIGYTAP